VRRGLPVLGAIVFAGTLAAAVFSICPASLTWFHAALQEKRYSWLEFLSAGSTAMALAVVLTSAALLALLVRRLATLAAARPRRITELAGDQGGALIFEFALVFPFILALVFILFQWAELLIADSLVHYAAFCCARSASTYAAATDGGDHYVLPSGNKKKKLTDSASFALHPAMAMEGLAEPKRLKPTVTLYERSGDRDLPASGQLRLEDTRLRSHGDVGVRVDWGLFPRWPLAQLFFRPILERGRIPLSRTYRMEIEPHLQSRNRFPSDLAYRQELTRKELHETILPVDHHLLLKIRTWYKARTNLESRQPRTKCPQERFSPPNPIHTLEDLFLGWR
jgi:hypothetical protein